jgi:23S rRNA (guanosine2251-2'-O)-methyltransferase
MSEKNLVFGLHAVQALLTSQPQRVVRLMLLKARDDQKIQTILELAESHAIKIEFVPRQELDCIL